MPGRGYSTIRARRSSPLTRILLILLTAATLRGQSPEEVFTEAWNVTRVAFYDEKMNGVDWDAVRAELTPKAATATSPAALSAVINDALGRLHASHTAHYIQDQREYYELIDIFWPNGVPERKGSRIVPGPAQYVGIGLATRTIDGKVFAEDVYDSGPAAAAGILPGDELVAIEEGPWGDVAPFREREGKPTKITIRRAPEATQDVTVTPVMIRPRDLFLASLKSSARLIENDGKKIAYVRVRSYGHVSYHDALKELLAGDLSVADGLVIDIRAGWGGASPQYMDIFNPVSPALTFRARDGKERVWSSTWRKPVAMIIDGGSRSGKEVLAHAFNQHKIGVLVGERTAGAVLAGTPRPLADGSVLYIAINDVRVDGEVLEGIGVEPDIKVDRALPYSQGKDPQIDAAVKAVAEKVK